MYNSMLIRELSCAVAPSGFEDKAAEIIVRRLEEMGARYAVTPDGAVAACVKCGKPSAPRLLIMTHMDEVGFMVKSHTEDGKLKVSVMGVYDTRLLTGRRVRVVGGCRELCGYIGAVPVHLSKGKSVPSLDDIYVDVGAMSKAEAEELAPIGSYGTFDTDFEEFGNGCVKGKALTSRVPCGVLLEVLGDILRGGHSLGYDLYFGFAVRGELRLSGAGGLYDRVAADGVICLGTREAGDTPGAANRSCRSGGGVCVPSLEEKYAYDSDLAGFLRRCGEENGIAVQNCIPTPLSAEKNYGVISLKNAGAAVAAVYIPVRNSGSACQTVKISDISAAGELIRAAVLNYGA